MRACVQVVGRAAAGFVVFRGIGPSDFFPARILRRVFRGLAGLIGDRKARIGVKLCVELMILRTAGPVSPNLSHSIDRGIGDWGVSRGTGATAVGQ